MQLSIHSELTGSYNLRISCFMFMLSFCTARQNGIDAKYANYSFVQEFMILSSSTSSKHNTERMNRVGMDRLREQLAQFRHLRAPEHESGGRSPSTLQDYRGSWIEIYPLMGTAKEVQGESRVEHTPDSNAGDA